MSNIKFRGKVHRFGKDINTDEIIPARYLNSTDAEFLAAHCMEDADPKFAKKVKKGDIIVAGKNFGCGSSREHAPRAIKAAGVSCVIASTFARIFHRNAINIGLPIIENKEASDKIRQSDKIEVDLDKGTIRNIKRKQKFKIEPYPSFIRNIINKDGLMNLVKRRRKEE